MVKISKPKNIIRKLKKITEIKRKEHLKRKWAENYTSENLDINWADYNYNRISIINLLFANQVNGKYLEIGCQNNTTFNSVIAKYKTGVDPEKGGTHRLTSDEFFHENTDKFDVAFLDGLHTYEQVRVDVRNALQSLNNGKGWIVFHDMLPLNWLEANVPRISKQWTGDVWKVAFELCETSNVEFRIVKIDHGVGVLYVPDNSLVDVADMISLLSDKKYDYFIGNYSSLPVVDYYEGRDWICSKI